VDLLGVVNESDAALTFYKINPHSTPAGRLEHVGADLADSTLALDSAEPYGGCSYRSGATGRHDFFVTWKDGTLAQVELRGDRRVCGRVVRRLAVGSRRAWPTTSAGTCMSARRRSGSGGTGPSRRTGRPERWWTASGPGRASSPTSRGSGSTVEATEAATSSPRRRAPGPTRDSSWTTGWGTMPGGGTFRVRGTDSTDGLDVTGDPLGPLFPRGLLLVHDSRPAPSRHRLVGLDRVAAPLGLVLDAFTPRAPRR